MLSIAQYCHPRGWGFRHFASLLAGYVWREAFPGDHVCVPPDDRAQAAYDNSQAVYRVVH